MRASNANKDFGILLAIVAIIAGLIFHKTTLFFSALILLFITILSPDIWKKPSALWAHLAEMLGAIVNRVILTVLFIGLVTPIGLIRRLLGKDPMNLSQFKSKSTSAFKKSNKSFKNTDLINPY